MIPQKLEIQARRMVIEARDLGGELWKHVTPATVEILVEAVALDLLERDESIPASRETNARIPPADGGSKLPP